MCLLSNMSQSQHAECIRPLSLNIVVDERKVSLITVSVLSYRRGGGGGGVGHRQLMFALPVCQLVPDKICLLKPNSRSKYTAKNPAAFSDH